MSLRTRILHLSCDFPDPLVPGKTQAVANLIRASRDFDHFVYSLNRMSWPLGIRAKPFAEDRIAVAYGAPPKGVLLTVFLDRLCTFLLDDIARRGLAFDIVHAHKLSVEGLLAERIAARLGVPYLCSIWGNTDVRLASLRPDLRSRWRAVADNARILLPAAPWAVDALDRFVPLDRRKVVLLPIVPTSERMMSATPTGPSLVSLFNLDHWRNKGASRLIPAVSNLRREIPGIELDIFGGGSERAVRELHRIISSAGADAFVHLRGPLANEQVIERLNGYAGLAIPSRRETFGMAYVEALFAGIPVIFSRGRAIDGYLPAEHIGFACDPADTGNIEEGLRRILVDQARLKESIAGLQASGGLEVFTATGITRAYSDAIAQARAGD